LFIFTSARCDWLGALVANLKQNFQGARKPFSVDPAALDARMQGLSLDGLNALLLSQWEQNERSVQTAYARFFICLDLGMIVPPALVGDRRFPRVFSYGQITLQFKHDSPAIATRNENVFRT